MLVLVMPFATISVNTKVVFIFCATSSYICVSVQVHVIDSGVRERIPLGALLRTVMMRVAARAHRVPRGEQPELFDSVRYSTSLELAHCRNAN